MHEAVEVDQDVISAYEFRRNDAALPKKVKGKHRWVLIVTHDFPSVAFEALATNAPVNLSFDTLHDVSIGCLDCEVQYSQKSKRTKCRAEIGTNE